MMQNHIVLPLFQWTPGLDHHMELLQQCHLTATRTQPPLLPKRLAINRVNVFFEMQRDLAHWVPSTDSESNGHTVDPGEYTLFVCHDSRGLGGDQGQAQGIKAEDGKCQSHVVTI